MALPIILVVNLDDARNEELRLILDYLEFEPILVTADDWRQKYTEKQAVDVILIGPADDSAPFKQLFEDIKAVDQHCPVIAMVDPANEALDPEVETATVAKIGVPIKHSELKNALQRARLYSDSRRNSAGSRSIELFRNLVGTSRAVRDVRQLIEQVAGTDASVLISGESGTGKEVVARNIHYQSKRRYKPFVPVNCGAIHPDLLESELFGHEKGAFTGAISTRRGRFEMADGGTLFLDEIGDMPLEMQVKLLRVIQERCFEHVGSNKSISMDVRIIAATHVDLDSAIEDGRFREDLFYRLSVFPIEMPSLRNRIEDIGLLINDLINRISSEKRGSVRLAPSAMQSLCRYRWPGNVRELANLMERLIILFPDGVVEAQDLPDKYRIGIDGEIETQSSGQLSNITQLPFQPAQFPTEGIDLKEHLVDVEFRLIEQALNQADGVVAHAAKLLNLGRTTLVEKMRKFGISRPTKASNI